ncbi:MAG: hypothetical protein KAI47_08655 [Deltaproteobacteria bacterium]|nr:hypothetical protein [Deltaproteobacteria bacterium]
MITTRWMLAGAVLCLLAASAPQDAAAQPTPTKKATKKPIVATADAATQAAAAQAATQAAMKQTIVDLKKTQAKLQSRLDKIEANKEAQELTALRQQATKEADKGGEVTKQADETEKTETQVFSGGQRALQALNPEISVVGDMIGQVIMNANGYTPTDRSGFFFRGVGLHFQAALDPFTLTKISIGISPSGVSLGEAYLTWTSILPGVSLTAGKFRQQFGVLNRWHQHGLDQDDWPIALREMFGDKGLNQTGVSVEWLMPSLWAHANQLVLQVTNGQNTKLFAGDLFSIPTVLVRLQSYYDLNESTYFELGLTGMLGWNNARGRPDPQGPNMPLENDPWRTTWAWGADWTLNWEPLKQAKYRNIVLRGELYGMRKDLGGGKHVLGIGLYQYVQAKISQSWSLGARFDWSQPFIENNAGKNIWGVEPYVSWWQSPWVHFRLHYSYTRSDMQTEDWRNDHRLILQAVFAAGPHKHDRY